MSPGYRVSPEKLFANLVDRAWEDVIALISPWEIEAVFHRPFPGNPVRTGWDVTKDQVYHDLRGCR